MNAVATTATGTVAGTAPEYARDLFVVLLTVGTGATDAIGFTRLGNVFASVMTGNLVLFGLHMSQGDAAAAGRAALAVVAFAVGVLFGSRLAGHRPSDGPVWPVTVTRALRAELVVSALLVVGWELSGGHPAGVLQTLLLAAAAVAMGMQSGAVQGLGVSGLSTTYMTGTLTSLMSSLIVRRKLETRGACVLLGLVGGAASSGLLILLAPRLAPLVPFAVLAYVVVAATRHARGERVAAIGTV